MPPKLSEKAVKSLTRLGVTVRLETPVTDCTADGVAVKGGFIPSRTIIWAAGVRASPVGQWLGADVALDRAGRVQVAPDLTVPGSLEIFVIGDAASVTSDGKPVPGVAPAAKQQGRYVADLIRQRLAGNASSKPFRYNDQGNLATIGRGAAVADMGWLKLSGNIAWWFWGIIHIFFLIDFRNRVSVAIDWLWSYLTSSRSARLMSESDPRKLSEGDPRKG